MKMVRKTEAKREKEKVLRAYNKQLKQKCHKCGKDCHQPSVLKIKKNKTDDNEKEETY